MQINVKTRPHYGCWKEGFMESNINRWMHISTSETVKCSQHVIQTKTNLIAGLFATNTQCTNCTDVSCKLVRNGWLCVQECVCVCLFHSFLLFLFPSSFYPFPSNLYCLWSRFIKPRDKSNFFLFNLKDFQLLQTHQVDLCLIVSLHWLLHFPYFPLMILDFCTTCFFFCLMTMLNVTVMHQNTKANSLNMKPTWQ